MTFTKADHDKAVELYQRFKDAAWWPGFTHWNQKDQAWQQNIDGRQWWDGNLLGIDHALSAIAWAMVQHLYATGGCEIAPTDPFGNGPVCYAYDNNAQGTPHYGPTPFQALAAAVEGMDKGG